MTTIDPDELLFPETQEGGCSAKLPARELESLLEGIGWLEDPNVLVGLNGGDDAGVYYLNEQTGLVLTTDFFPPFCRNAALFGEIASVNALSDIYAMGGRPLAALNITLFPADPEWLPLLRKVLEGGAKATRRAGIPVVGGHTIANPKPVYGMAILGLVNPNRIVQNNHLVPGQKLILTNPLGTGVATVAHRLGIDTNSTFEAAIESMRQLNQQAAEVMLSFGIETATDITGFGLGGHAYKMARESNVTIEISASSLPHFPGVPQLIAMGCIPGAAFRNSEYLEGHIAIEPGIPPIAEHLLCDPQTSGGLLMGVPEDLATQVVQRLHEKGYPAACCIGQAKPTGQHPIVLVR